MLIILYVGSRGGHGSVKFIVGLNLFIFNLNDFINMACLSR